MKDYKGIVENSFLIENKTTRAFVEDKVGLLGPVDFYKDDAQCVSPYYISHWCGKRNDQLPHCNTLKGDFFCLPFGGNNVYAGHNYGCHGPGANGVWSVSSKADDSIEMKMKFPDTETRLTKRIRLGNNCIYQEHLVQGCEENLPYGHHPIMDCSHKLYLSNSPFRFGIVTRESDVPYLDGEYHALLGHALFNMLEKVPARQVDKPYEDCSVYPARQGYVDLIQMVHDKRDIAWTVASCPDGGYLWYSLKNPKVLPTTLFWMENRGRHFAPWDGINCCIGIEDVCSCFAEGAAVSSVENDLTRMGVRTAHQFSKDETFMVRHIQGAVKIPKNFTKVVDVQFEGGEKLIFTDINGLQVTANEVDYRFVL